jgi:ABC-type sugar transport system ATPase subunit
METILEMRGISKSFSGVKVLDAVNFDIRRGEVHALIGENGAGKSTLMKILMGVVGADAGTILIDGDEVHIHSPSRAFSLGLAMIHQELVPVLDMTVAENIFLGREIRRFGLVNKKKQEKEAGAVLSSLGLSISPGKLMRELSVSGMQMVEIAKTISRGARIIIMDEPTSAITETEIKKLFEVIGLLCRKGIGIAYISHRLEELFVISDRITVLRDGHYIGTSGTRDITKDRLIGMMVGREITEIFPEYTKRRGELVMRIRNFTRKGEFRNISFDVYAGERLGIGGLMGAGRSELVMAIFGERRVQEGTLYLHGKETVIKSPGEAIARRIALITEDRKRYGLNLLASVRTNITSVIEGKLSRWGVFNGAKAAAVTGRMIESMNIKVMSPLQPVNTLSGGNQQKVVLAKWLVDDIDIIIFDEPTRGIDVGTKAEIYRIINSLAGEGKAVIIISSEMPELTGMTDRIIVLREGEFMGELEKGEITQERIMSLASGL